MESMLRCKECKRKNPTVKLVKVGVPLCMMCDGRRKTVPGLGHGRRRRGEDGGGVVMGGVVKEVENKK